jgi:hypothetical protein
MRKILSTHATPPSPPADDWLVRGGAPSLPAWRLDARCLWAVAATRRDVVLVARLRRDRPPSRKDLDEIAAACWDASVVLAGGTGVLVLAASGYARGREVACGARLAAHVRRLGAAPVPGPSCRCGRLLTATSWRGLVECAAREPALEDVTRGRAPWLQCLRAPKPPFAPRPLRGAPA